MKSIFGALLTLSALISFSSIAAPPKNSSDAVLAAAKALENQLNCIKNPEPGKVIRAMLTNGMLKKTKFNADGIPVLAPTSDIYLYGKKVKFVTGWEIESDGSVKKLFSRGPGTSPPHFIAVLLDANPRDVHYMERKTKIADDYIEYPYSSIEETDSYYEKSGTTITCYGEPAR